jgi:hypothetical protein
MEATPRPENDPTPTGVPGDSRLWLLPILALFAWQGWITLTLFGTERPWEALCDDRPVLSGQHPLHQYHGHLGARAFLQHGSTSCYDFSFQSGYPKTPVFDGGSRPAELFLTLVGGDFRPDAYKVGLAVSCLLVPLVLCVASRGAGLCRRAVFLSVLLGLMVWWGRPSQQALHEGDLDLMLAALSALALSGLLIRYDRKPGGRAYLGTLAAGFLGWLFHPLLMALLLPAYLIYYLSVGARHRMVWSVLLLGGLFLAVAANYFWLRDWVGYWWLRAPLGSGELLSHRTLAGLWRAPLWGESFDRALTLALFVLGTTGVVLLNERGQRAAARLFGLASLLLIVLAVGGVLNEMLGRFSSSGLLVPALLFLVPLAAHALECGWRCLRGLAGHAWLAGALVCSLLVGLLLLPGVSSLLRERFAAARPLALGLGPAEQEVVDALLRHTTPDARVLWEGLPRERLASGWTALLPLLTGRSFIGGLDPASGIEHTLDGLVRRTLAGRPLDEWSDAELTDYCRRYNVGWVVCWSAPARERFARWPTARVLATLAGGEGTLFVVKRPHSFILKGKARWLGTELSRVRLADVVPEDGEVVLSLHYQAGLVASPARVKVEPTSGAREDGQDGQVGVGVVLQYEDIPFIRLKVSSPVAHLTLVWQK